MNLRRCARVGRQVCTCWFPRRLLSSGDGGCAAVIDRSRCAYDERASSRERAVLKGLPTCPRSAPRDRAGGLRQAARFRGSWSTRCGPELEPSLMATGGFVHDGVGWSQLRGLPVDALFWSHVATLKSEDASASLARGFVRRRLIDHHLTALVEDVRLVVSEFAERLISQRDEASFSVCLRGGGGEVLLTVQDGPAVSFEPLTGGQSADGQDLPLTRRLSERWGLDPARASGCALWASFPSAPAVPSTQRVPRQRTPR